MQNTDSKEEEEQLNQVIDDLIKETDKFVEEDAKKLLTEPENKKKIYISDSDEENIEDDIVEDLEQTHFDCTEPKEVNDMEGYQLISAEPVVGVSYNEKTYLYGKNENDEPIKTITLTPASLDENYKRDIESQFDAMEKRNQFSKGEEKKDPILKEPLWSSESPQIVTTSDPDKIINLKIDTSCLNKPVKKVSAEEIGGDENLATFINELASQANPEKPAHSEPDLTKKTKEKRSTTKDKHSETSSTSKRYTINIGTFTGGKIVFHL